MFWGLKPGIDFTGGSLLRVKFNQAELSAVEIKQALGGGGAVTQGATQKEKAVLSNDPLLKNLNSEKSSPTALGNLGEITTQPVGKREVLIKMRSLTEPEHQLVLSQLRQKVAEKSKEENTQEEIKSTSGESVEEVDFQSIGAKVGKELRQKTQSAIILVLISILIYVAWAFRGISGSFNKYESFRYGTVAIIALAHDILITVGVFSVLGRFGGVEVNSFFIAALLTILGYSVNDTIIIFDRIRENVLAGKEDNFRDLVDRSINETLTRSLNTSFATLITLFAILIWGGASTFYFALALIVGITLGSYSSIFVASPLLIWWKEKRG
jgi:preprotein translocase subunit SecF